MKRIFYIILFLALSAATAAQDSGASSANRVVIGGEYYYVHTVQPGETLYSLGRKYRVSQDDLVKNNPHIAEGLRAGEAIKIPAPAPDPLPRNIRNRTTSNRRVEVHTVNQGETAYSIAKRYAITVDDMIDANPDLDPARLGIGQRILIPRDMIGSSTQSEIESGFAEYTEALSEVTDGWSYRLVAPGETLWSLSRELGVPEDSLQRYNPSELAAGLKAGSMLRFPAEKRYAGGPVPPVFTDPDPGTTIVYEDVDAKPVNRSRPLQVALLLPFTVNGQSETSMIDYYNGTLLGLQDLKAQGISVDLTVFDTRRSAAEVRSILRDDRLDGADLILGPRTEEAFEEASRFAYRHRIPIVSPQSPIESGNPFAYQIRPESEYQYDKLKPFLTGDYNVVLITPSAGADAEFMREIERLLPPNTRRVAYNGRASSSAVQNALSREKENIVIVPTADENKTDEILSNISSIQNYFSSRTGRGFTLRVVGAPQWARFRDIDKELFFKLQAMYITLYYADRTNPAVASFDGRYLAAFGTLPSLFSYRGYDVAKLFVSALHRYGDRYAESIDRVDTGLLQVPYHFRRSDEGKWVNDEWVLVLYRNDYIIDVK